MTLGMTAATRPPLDTGAIDEAIMRAALSSASPIAIVIEHADVGSATGAAVDALRAAGLDPAVVRVVERPGVLAADIALPAGSGAVVIADARRGRRSQIEEALRKASNTAGGLIVVLTAHSDARTVAQVARETLGVDPTIIRID